ncbi:FAD-dependent oxidoreductase [Kribbella sp. NPDC004536]|uniref:oxidoreductase n=1 Tax=Kribbella sp. NPDC004536 TaxID=3364106 RepID=UPI0036CA56A9
MKEPLGVLSPFNLGNLRLRNRVVVASHTTNYAHDDGTPSDRMIAYYRARARGGAALIVCESVRVHPLSRTRQKLAITSPDTVERFGQLTAAIHAEGASCVVQLAEHGRHFPSDRSVSWSASDVPWTVGAPVPHALDRGEIREISEGFGRAAALMERAGADGVEVHIGHGHLLQQFLSPLSNERHDEYGGGTERRMRFTTEVLDAVFSAVGSEFLVGIRLSASEMAPGGLELDDMLDITARLNSRFPLSFLSVSQSAFTARGGSLSTLAPDSYFGPMPFKEFPKAFKEAFPGLPVIAAGRIDDLAAADSLVTGGYADLTSMTRAHIADPDLVGKWQRGAGSTIRSCIACNQTCLKNLEFDRPMSCLVNPDAGEEFRLAKPSVRAAARDRVLVVGGGPAGMEAAVWASRSGSSVVLAERATRLGGQVRLAAAVTGRERLVLLADELEREVADERIDVCLDRNVTVQEIFDGGFDAVILATGSREPARTLTGYGPLLGPSAAISSGDGTKGPVAIIDEDGGWTACSLALHLARNGRRVSFVTPLREFAGQLAVQSRIGVAENMRQAQVDVHLLRNPLSWSAADGLVVEDVVGGALHAVKGVENVVMVASRVANDELAKGLAEAAYPGRVVCIGDAYAPRTCREAVREGRETGRAVCAPA